MVLGRTGIMCAGFDSWAENGGCVMRIQDQRQRLMKMLQGCFGVTVEAMLTWKEGSVTVQLPDRRFSINRDILANGSEEEFGRHVMSHWDRAEMVPEKPVSQVQEAAREPIFRADGQVIGHRVAAAGPVHGADRLVAEDPATVMRTAAANEFFERVNAHQVAEAEKFYQDKAAVGPKVGTLADSAKDLEENPQVVRLRRELSDEIRRNKDLLEVTRGLRYAKSKVNEELAAEVKKRDAQAKVIASQASSVQDLKDRLLAAYDRVHKQSDLLSRAAEAKTPEKIVEWVKRIRACGGSPEEVNFVAQLEKIFKPDPLTPDQIKRLRAAVADYGPSTMATEAVLKRAWLENNGQVAFDGPTPPVSAESAE